MYLEFKDISDNNIENNGLDCLKEIFKVQFTTLKFSIRYVKTILPFVL